MAKNATQSDQEKRAARAAAKVAAFKKLATKRTQNVILMVERLGQLSNKNSYSFDAAQVAKIFTALKSAVEQTEKRFSGTEGGFAL